MIGNPADGGASGGGGGYPAAGIGRWWSWPEVGGDHGTGSGGFSGGGGDTCSAGYNGLGSMNNIRNSFGTGGGYYAKSTGNQGVSVWFNQGGMWQGSDELSNTRQTDSWKFFKDYSGSGGNSGAGGLIYYTNEDNIYSYNGDRVTNGDYETILYEYQIDGTETEDIAPVLIKLNGSKFVQSKIFAQDGIIRAIYKTNQAMSREECEKYEVQYVEKEKAKEKQTKNVKIKDETTTSTTGYGQGIGSRSTDT